MFQVQVGLGSLPIVLFCLGDGSVAMQPSQQFSAVFDQQLEGVQAMFDMNGYSIDGVEYKYGEKVFYKEIPSVLQWLQKQELQMPVFQNSPFGANPFGI